MVSLLHLRSPSAVYDQSFIDRSHSGKWLWAGQLQSGVHTTVARYLPPPTLPHSSITPPFIPERSYHRSRSYSKSYILLHKVYGQPYITSQDIQSTIYYVPRYMVNHTYYPTNCMANHTLLPKIYGQTYITSLDLWPTIYYFTRVMTSYIYYSNKI